jgi:hypothetical protein
MRIGGALLALLFFTVCVWAQKPAPPADKSADLDAPATRTLIEKQFGPGFAPLQGFTPLTADFDGDGVPDLALAAHATNPLLNAIEYHYKVVDPYDAYFGFGDPRITLQFGTDDPREKGFVVLIIHGAKGAGWQAPTPKAKFVLVKLPFTKLSLSCVMLHKRPVGAIAAEETDTVSSVIYWDGKKYKYEPAGAVSE